MRRLETVSNGEKSSQVRWGSVEPGLWYGVVVDGTSQKNDVGEGLTMADDVVETQTAYLHARELGVSVLPLMGAVKCKRERGLSKLSCLLESRDRGERRDRRE